ncbi:MAG: hypothetical protein Fur003_1390 [Candidatus Dojkabacteria bacterium]
MKFPKKLLLIIPLLILIGIGAFFAFQYLSAQNNDKYKELISKAEAQEKAHNYAASLNRFNEAAELVPSRREAYLGIVRVLVLKGQLDEAAKIINASEPSLGALGAAQAWFTVGEGYYNQGDYDNAAKHLKLSINKSKYDENKMLYAMSLAKTGKLNDVDQYLTEVDFGKEFAALWEDYQAVKTNSTSTLFEMTQKSKAYINGGFPYLAIGLLEPKKNEMVEYWEGLFFLGKAYYDTGDNAKAIATLEETLTLGTQDPTLYMVLARAYYDTNEIESAYKDYDQAVAFAPKNLKIDYLKEYLTILALDKQITKSEQLLKSYVDQTKLEELYLYVVFYDLAEDQTKLKEFIPKVKAKAVATWADLYAFNFTSAKFYIADKAYPEAQAIIDEMLKADPYDANAKYLEGLLYYNKEENSKAEDALEAALDYDLTGAITSDAKELLSQIK